MVKDIKNFLKKFHKFKTFSKLNHTLLTKGVKNDPRKRKIKGEIKMKSTKILAATLSLVSLIGLSACGAKKPADTVSLPDISGKPDQSVTQQQTPDLETEPVLPENIYEAENFTFNTSFPDAVGGIKFVDATANYVVDEEGTVLNVKFSAS